MIGTYYKTEFRNESSGETVFYVMPMEPCEHVVDGLLKCRGYIGIYEKNMPICLTGDYVNDYFSVTDCFIARKSDMYVRKIVEYIDPDLTENQIEKITKLSEGDIFTLVERKEIISEINNIIPKQSTRVRRLIERIRAFKKQEELTRELLKYGIGIDRIENLIKKKVTLDQIDENPYMTLLKCGESIRSAEMLSQRNPNIRPYSMCRLLGFTYDAMTQITNEGNSCAKLNQITSCINYKMKTAGIYDTQVTNAITYLCLTEMKKVFSFYFSGDNRESYIYFRKVLSQENTIIKNVERLQANKRQYTCADDVDKIEEQLKVRYTPEQKAVFKAVETGGVKILTGPPGSGKTAVIRGLIEHFGNRKVKLAATTGRASQVMHAVCGRPAKTVNKLLNVIPYNDEIKGKDLNDPVDAELVIVDEISMIGVQLFANLVQALRSGAVLLLVGDEDQLQSVDYGNVLHDLIQCGKIDVFRLTKVIRQSGTIYNNAARINKGWFNLINDNKFMIFECLNESEIKMRLQQNIVMNQSQVLSPVKNGEIGTNALNEMMQDKNRKRLLVYGKRNFYEGDKVIMTENNYDMGYMNGDIGCIIGVESENLVVDYGEKKLHLARQDLKSVDLAYAITIHKSQGSEFDDVHIILPNDADNMMCRRLLYTAVTRAKKRVFIYYIGDTLRHAIYNQNEIARNSLLSTRIKQEIV